MDGDKETDSVDIVNTGVKTILKRGHTANPGDGDSPPRKHQAEDEMQINDLFMKRQMEVAISSMTEWSNKANETEKSHPLFSTVTALVAIAQVQQAQITRVGTKRGKQDIDVGPTTSSDDAENINPDNVSWKLDAEKYLYYFFGDKGEKICVTVLGSRFCATFCHGDNRKDARLKEGKTIEICSSVGTIGTGGNHIPSRKIDVVVRERLSERDLIIMQIVGPEIFCDEDNVVIPPSTAEPYLLLGYSSWDRLNGKNFVSAREGIIESNILINMRGWIYGTSGGTKGYSGGPCVTQSLRVVGMCVGYESGTKDCKAGPRSMLVSGLTLSSVRKCVEGSGDEDEDITFN